MKKINAIFITAILLLFYVVNTQAQTNARTAGKTKGKVVVTGNHGMISFGAGSNTPGTASKNNSYLTNSTAINADAYIPLIASKKGWDGCACANPNNCVHVKGKGKPPISFGINVSGTYDFGSKKNPSAPLPAAFAVTGQTSSNVAYKGVDPKSPGFRVGVGPQVNFHLGNHFSIATILSAEYFSIKQKSLSAVQTTQYNGKPYEFNVTTLPETKTSGFAFTPKVKLNYMITPTIGLFIQGGYTLGPKVKTTLINLVPNGPAQTPGNTYNLQQLQTATYVNGTTKSTAYNAAGFGGGISIAFGKHKNDWPQKRTAKNDWPPKRTAGDGTKGTNGTPTGITNTDANDNNPNNNSVLRRPSHWWNHWTGMNCGGAGIYCISPLRSANETLDVDQTVGNTDITLVDNNIVITTIGDKGNVSKEIINKFAAKDVQLFDNELPNDIAEKLFKKINLKLPNEKIVLKANDQRYQVIDGEVEGKPAQIIESEEKTIIKIEGKEYNLTIVTASGKATNTQNSYTNLKGNCCPSVVAGSIKWDDPNTTSTAFVTAPPGLGTVSLGTMGSGLLFNASITNCNSFSSCSATVVYKVYNSSYSLVYTSPPVLSGTSFTIPSTYFTPAGSYGIEVIRRCGGSKCATDIFQLTTTGCCTGGSWGVKQLRNHTTYPYIPIPSTITAAEGAPIYYDVNFNCAAGSGCSASILYEYYNAASVLISSSTYPSGVVMAGIITPAGAAYVTITAICAGQRCNSFTSKITPPPCCAGISWSGKHINTLVPIFTLPAPVGTVYDVSSIPCFPTVPNSLPSDFQFHKNTTVALNFSYTSTAGCSPCQVTYQIFDNFMNGIASGTGTCGVDYNYPVPNYTVTGYYLRVTALSGSGVCTTCTYKIDFIP